ncbi:MAG: GcrA family cell cycle regulator, partial [Roseiarcus sp.]
MSWTDEKVELLRQLWLDGRSASQISAALGQGLTRNAVIGKVHRLGLAGRAKTSSPASSGSGTPRAAPPRRMAPRAASVGSG